MQAELAHEKGEGVASYVERSDEEKRSHRCSSRLSKHEASLVRYTQFTITSGPMERWSYLSF